MVMANILNNETNDMIINWETYLNHDDNYIGMFKSTVDLLCAE